MKCVRFITKKYKSCLSFNAIFPFKKTWNVWQYIHYKTCNHTNFTRDVWNTLIMKQHKFFFCLMVFNATLNNILAISLPSVLLLEEIGEPGENHWPVASHRHHYYIMLYSLSWSRLELATSVLMGTDCIGSCKSNYHTNTAKTAPEKKTYLIWFHLIYATFSNISAISWWPVLVVEEAGVPGEIHRPWGSNW
jgi:hypothetical protein